MFRLHVAAQSVSMAADGMNHILPHTGFPQKAGRFLTVLLRIQFKINIMKESHLPPEFLILPISQFPGIPSHDPLYCQAMKNMKWLLVIFFKQFKGLLPV